MERKRIDLDHVEELARISLTDKEKERFSTELEDFILYADMLDIFSSARPFERSGSERADVGRADVPAPRADLGVNTLTDASRISNGYVFVPLTVEEGEK